MTGRRSEPLSRVAIPQSGNRFRNAEAVYPEDLLGPLTELERKYAPAKLYVAGDLGKPLPHPRVSIVGTRHPSEEGLDAATRISASLARLGAIIVSGLAEGIDTAAHRAAIDAGGKTIAVLGTPLSRAYPAKNSSLQRLIMTKHLAISQFPEGRPIHRKNFVLRNRTMALLSDATVIVESGESGGSLHQGWEAIRLGRPLFIRKPVLSDPRLDWPRSMADYGAVE
ncbi:MAG: DNA-processing protein DprA, partial [Methanobacteriota archaeon]